MNIRTASTPDIAAIVRFQLAMALETENLRLDKATVTLGVQSIFTDPGKGRYWVAELDGDLVASLLITYEWSDWRNGQVWWIQSVYVREQFRRQGVFTRMYQHIQQLAVADPEVQGIRLYADNRNSQAHAVYLKLGMNGDHYRLFEWMKQF